MTWRKTTLLRKFCNVEPVRHEHQPAGETLVRRVLGKHECAVVRWVAGASQSCHQEGIL